MMICFRFLLLFPYDFEINILFPIPSHLCRILSLIPSSFWVKTREKGSEGMGKPNIGLKMMEGSWSETVDDDERKRDLDFTYILHDIYI